MRNKEEEPTMQISRQDIDTAAEMVDLYEGDYSIRETYSGRNMYGRTCAAVDLPGIGKLMELLVALAVLMTETGRQNDALELAATTETDSMEVGFVAYWPGTEIV